MSVAIGKRFGVTIGVLCKENYHKATLLLSDRRQKVNCNGQK